MTNRPILLVEDDLGDIKLTQRAFAESHLGNELIVMEDGQSALDYLFSDPSRELPAVVVLNLKLPRVNGLEVLRAIRAHPRTCLVPIVVLTTSQEEQDLFESYGLGANSYVRKPADFTLFALAIAQLSVYWLALNEVAPPGKVSRLATPDAPVGEGAPGGRDSNANPLPDQ